MTEKLTHMTPGEILAASVGPEDIRMLSKPLVTRGVKKGELNVMISGTGGRQSDATLLMQARYVLRDLHAKHPDAGYGKMAEAVERAAIKEEKGQ